MAPSLRIKLERSYYRVSAVVDSLGKPESFVTWRVFALPDTIRPVSGAVTGADSLINATLAAPGEYRLSLVGMESKPEERPFTLSEAAPSVNLGKIMLIRSFQQCQGYLQGHTCFEH